MNRKFWVLGFLASACFFGCSEGDDKGLLPSTGCNNNGVLDAGEICDGTLFATGKRVCPDGKVLADGKTVESITCSDKCMLVTEGVCVDPAPAATCGNKELDDGEACDGDKFADGKRVCPVGSILAEGKTLADIKCSKTCTVVTEGVCIEPEPAATCGNDNLDENEGEVCEGDKFATGKRVCPEGMEFGSGKTEADIRCTSNCLIDTSLACVPALKTKCDGTKYCICSSDDKECTCEDCSEKGEICGTVDGKASCVEKTCKVSEGEFVCEGNGAFLGWCIPDVDGGNEGHLTIENCASRGLVCEIDATTKEGKCALERCTTLGEAVCVGSVLRTCMEDDGANRWLDDDCEAQGQMCQNNACVDKPLCGNGINDPNEDCDPNANPPIPSWKQIDCYKYDTPDNPKSTYSKLFISGQPTCGPKCKISTDQCVEANDSDFAQVKKWSYTSMSSIIDATKSGTVVMNGVFDEHSVYNEQKGGWGLGNWTKSAFGKSITFIVGKTTKNSVKVSIDVTRTDNKSPDRIKMRVLDGSTTLATTEEIIISDTKKQTLTAYARGVGSVKNLRVEFTAYFSGQTNAKHVVINNIVVSEVDAL